MFTRIAILSYLLLFLLVSSLISLSLRTTDKDYKFIEKIEKKKRQRKNASAYFTKENVNKEIIAGERNSELYMEYPLSHFSLHMKGKKSVMEETMSDIFAIIDDNTQEERMILTGGEGKYTFPKNFFFFQNVDLCFLDQDGKFLLRTKAQDITFGLEPKNPQITMHDIHANFDALP